jgi:hypothetical protein
MTLSDLAALGSFVSGVAVLASLVYLALQLRQAQRNQQASIRQGRAQALMEWNLKAAEPGINETISKLGANAASNMSELSQYLSMSRAGFQLYEESFDQRQAGLLSDEAHESFLRNVAATLSVPGFRVAWKMQRSMFGEAFAGFIDKSLDETPCMSLNGTLEQWNAAVLAERG